MHAANLVSHVAQGPVVNETCSVFVLPGMGRKSGNQETGSRQSANQPRRKGLLHPKSELVASCTPSAAKLQGPSAFMQAGSAPPGPSGYSKAKSKHSHVSQLLVDEVS